MKKAKKALVFLMVLALTLSMSLSAFAASDKSNNGNGKDKALTASQSGKSVLQKDYKQQLTELKKQTVADLSTLEARYLEISTSTIQADIDEAAALLTQIADLQAQMKQLINERYMIIKTPYTEEKLTSLGSLDLIIAEMYADAYNAANIDVTVNKSGNLIKIETLPYLKGGKIMIPVRAIENLGTTVNYVPGEQIVTITKDGIEGMTVVLGIGSIAASSTQAVTLAGVPPTLTADPEGIVTGSVTGSISGGLVGDFTGNANGTFTGPVTGDPLTQAITGTVIGTIIDPILGETEVSGVLSGTLATPIITMNSQVSTLDMPVPTELTNGRAYVPLQFLAETFGLEVTLDTENNTLDLSAETTEETIE